MSDRKRVLHSPQQIVEKLQEADRLLNAGQSLGQVLQALAVSQPTYHRWRQQYGGMKAREAKRLKELEQENTRLKRLLADARLDNDIRRWVSRAAASVISAGSKPMRGRCSRRSSTWSASTRITATG